MDQNKYINTYIDIIVGQLHELLNSNLQLKTQIKLANDLIQEKDQIIGNLQNQLSSIQHNDSDVQIAKDQAKHWEDSYHAMTNKVAHMETLLTQIKNMKATVLEKDNRITELSKELEELKMPKKVINTKVKKLEVVKDKQPTDDF